MANWELKENSIGELKVSIEGEAWKKAQDKAFDKLAKNVEVAGFRKGQAPRKLVEKHISKQNVMIEAIESVANELLQEGIKEHNLEVVARPELKNLDELQEDKATVTFEITVKPEVELGEYKGLAYNVENVEVSEEEIANELKRLQERYAEMQVKEVAENGDTVTIDFEGFKDGVAFEGGKAEKYDLVLGSNSFIPGFEDQLVGTKAEDEKEVNVSFPENYHVQDLAGAPVVFKVKVHEVKTKVLPELDDEFAKDVNAQGVETIDQLKEHIKNNLTADKTRAAEDKALNELMTKVVDGVKVDIPQAMIDEETNSLINDFAMRLQQQGMGLDQFLKMTNQTMDAIKAQFETDALNKVKFRLVLEAIANKEGLSVEEGDVENEYKNIADSYGMDVEEVKKLIPAENLEYDVKIRKAYDLIKDTANK
ncbi:MAG: trigger factor [Erysipelotrichaceae bacterium]|nr:trigger factor [Erysipelotrichaceae bacterium]MDY5252353.1 trigger factor [Erysipelotrichaceae bacterium]